MLEVLWIRRAMMILSRSSTLNIIHYDPTSDHLIITIRNRDFPMPRGQASCLLPLNPEELPFEAGYLSPILYGQQGIIKDKPSIFIVLDAGEHTDPSWGEISAIEQQILGYVLAMCPTGCRPIFSLHNESPVRCILRSDCGSCSFW
jgi:hypothetical protein